MKALVYFNPGEKNDVFQGMRLRKNIKGSLELVGVDWVDSLYALPDIVHLISPEDEAKAHDAKLDGLSLVVSALYTEEDPFARFLSKATDGAFFLKNKAMRTLEEADLILVPNPEAKSMLETVGPKGKRIEILSPGVNLSRFEKNDPIEKNVFYRYFRFSDKDKFVLSVGDYDDEAALDALEQVAKLTPNVRFFFLGLSKKGRVSAAFLKKENRKSPANLTYSDVVEDDVYRSGMMCANAFLALPFLTFDTISVLEAMAAKTQVVVLGKYSKPVVDGKKPNAFFSQTSEKTARIIESYCLGKLSPTIIEGYRTAKANSLLETGKKLTLDYESLLRGMEEKR